MAPRRKSPARALGRPITSILMPDLKHPLSYVGRQVGIPGALWVGRQTAAELATEFKCTIREFSYAHLFSGGFVPEKAWQVQEMGVSGSGSLEVGDSSGDIFWIKNSEFLKYFYKTYPELKISPPSATAPAPGAGSSSNLNSCSGDGGGGDDDGGGGAVAGDGGDSSATTEGGAAVYDYFTLSKEMVMLGPKNGQLKLTYTCNLQLNDGSACTGHRNLYRKNGQIGSNTNLHNHIKELAGRGDTAHVAALASMDANNMSKVEVNGKWVTKMNFAEAFGHHVKATLMRAAGVASARFFQRPELKEYVRGYQSRAVFPHNIIMTRIATCIDELQFAEQKARFKVLDAFLLEV